MKKKALWIGLASLALVAMVGTGSALAASGANNEGRGEPPAWAQAPELMDEHQAEMAAQMEERQAEMAAKMAEQQARWEALPAAQKQQILDLQIQQLQLEQQLIAKYQELGLLDSEAAEQRLAQLTEQLAALENGELPLLGRPGAQLKMAPEMGEHGPGRAGGPPPIKPEL